MRVMKCPRCGKEDLEIVRYTDWDWLETLYYPLCHSCGFTTREAFGSEELAMSWLKFKYNTQI